MKAILSADRILLPLACAFMVLALMAGCAGNCPDPGSTPPPLATSRTPYGAAADTVTDLAGFSGRIYLDGRVYVAGQPDPDALRAMPLRDVTAVINLRTPKEMADTSKVAFDEAALVDSLGLDYVEIPLGGKDFPYTPAAVQAFASALEKHTGPVLLHCASGGRASHLWAAYLVDKQGWSVTHAYDRGETIGISTPPFAKFLEIDVEVVAKKP